LRRFAAFLLPAAAFGRLGFLTASLMDGLPQAVRALLFSDGTGFSLLAAGSSFVPCAIRECLGNEQREARSEEHEYNMKSIVCAVLAMVAGCVMVFAQTADVQKVLTEIKAKDKGLLAVSEEDGRFLRLMIATKKAQRALEIGGASGYSAIWIGLGLRDTGGRLVTIEYDPVRAKELAENIKRTGLSDIVQVLAGDAFQQIPKVPGTFDFVFLDAWKKDYKRFFDMVFPRLDKGGLFLAHNVVNKKSEMGDFLDAIQRPSMWTTIVAPSGEGMSVTLKR
jgi:predicted O-methyltransferase YrrM